MRRRRSHRHEEILAILEREGSVRIADLQGRFGLSKVALRMDLADLEQQGALIRTFGGAIRAHNGAAEMPYLQRVLSHPEEKQRIGRAAADLVRDGEIVILDTGTTTLEVARHLAARPSVAAITNDLSIAMEYARQMHPQAHVLGGVLSPLHACLLGPGTERALSQVRADRAFLAADAIAGGHVLERSPLVIQVKRAMIRAAKEVTLVADSSKFGQTGLSPVCDFAPIHRVVTDSGVDPSVLEALRAQTEVLVV
ncbi:MAG: DeoR/GlpR transcriptional regulator [Armatimonadetes bacterium]|nr:DeoR/GlpR transcriptional regulator [Armatimonadota bacterium]